MRLLFARHGESEANLRHEIANRDSTHALTATGRLQAEALGASLRSQRVTRIVSSPLRRAVETAEIVGRVLGVPVGLAEALREYDCGVFEGRSDAAAWEAYAQVREQWEELCRADARLEGGESLADMRARFAPFVRGLIAGSGRDDCVVLLSHGGLYRCVLPEILVGIDPKVARDRGLGYARYVIADARPDGVLECVDWPA
jgi:broad specificity phosphatase PhoE